jgi:hypothetical protein
VFASLRVAGLGMRGLNRNANVSVSTRVFAQITRSGVLRRAIASARRVLIVTKTSTGIEMNVLANALRGQSFAPLLSYGVARHVLVSVLTRSVLTTKALR